MNILWIYDRPLNPEAGGTERITSLVAKGLSQKGHHCLGMAVFEEHKDGMTFGGKTYDQVYDFLKVHQVDVVINQIAYSNWLLDKFLLLGGQKWREEGGYIISCLHFDPKNPSYLYLLRLKRKKTCADLFHLLKAYLLYSYYGKKQRKKEGTVYNHIYDSSDRFVTLSPTHFPYLKQVMKRERYSKLVAINNPLTFDEISHPDILKEKRNWVLVCARMSEYHKRISLTLKAWQIVQRKSPCAKDWMLKIVGDGPDLNAYKQYVVRKEISNISFEGQQSPELYYQAARILLLTSSAEGWGLTLTEGLQRAVVPIVMDSSPVFSEIIKNGDNGFITPDRKLRTFAKKIIYLMENRLELEQMQLNALSSSEAFGMARTIEKWEKILTNHNTHIWT